MESQHLSSIRIQNFKRFIDLEIQNLGQFNLIVGDNNTGKTCLLEALCVMDQENSFEDILTNFYQFALKDRTPIEKVAIETDILQIQYKVEEGFRFLKRANKADPTICFEGKLDEFNGFHIQLMKNEDGFALIRPDNAQMRLSELKHTHKTFRLGNYVTIADTILQAPRHVAWVGENVQMNRKIRNEFIEVLKIFSPAIEDIRMIGKLPYIGEKDRDEYLPLSAYGWGFVKSFAVLTELSRTPKGGKLLIDEVDAGIHFAHFQLFWKSLLRIAHQKNVQIFATTHNLECIQSFQQVLEQDEELKAYQQAARVVSLRERPQNREEVYARVYDFEGLRYAAETEREIRGGVL